MRPRDIVGLRCARSPASITSRSTHNIDSLWELANSRNCSPFPWVQCVRRSVKVAKSKYGLLVSKHEILALHRTYS